MLQLIPLLISAAAAAGGQMVEASANRKKDRKAQEGILQQTARRDAANKRVNQNLDVIAKSNPNDERKARIDEYMGALQRNPTTAGGQVGNVSKAYREGSAATDKSVGDTSSQLASVMARIDSAGDQRRGEDYGTARTGSAIDVEKNLADGDAFTNKMQIDAIQPNPWAMMASKIGMAAGASMGAGGGLGGMKPDLASLGSVAKARTAGTLLPASRAAVNPWVNV